MTGQNIPFGDRPDVKFAYPGIRQSRIDTCVFASNAGAVNYLTARQIWTEQALIVQCLTEGERLPGPGVGRIAHSPVASDICYRFNTRNEFLLENKTVRKWVENENKIVILSRPYQHDQGYFHMLTLVAWDTDHYVAWDTAGKMSIIYEHEIEGDIPYQNRNVLIPHPNHDAFVYWKNATAKQ